MLARMVWGTYAVKIEVQMGNCLIVEGSKMLARMVWSTYTVKIEVQMGNCLIVEESKNACQDVLGHLTRTSRNVGSLSHI